jgi:hypothetical protein
MDVPDALLWNNSISDALNMDNVRARMTTYAAFARSLPWAANLACWDCIMVTPLAFAWYLSPSDNARRALLGWPRDYDPLEAKAKVRKDSDDPTRQPTSLFVDIGDAFKLGTVVGLCGRPSHLIPTAWNATNVNEKRSIRLSLLCNPRHKWKISSWNVANLDLSYWFNDVGAQERLITWMTRDNGPDVNLAIQNAELAFQTGRDFDVNYRPKLDFC